MSLESTSEIKLIMKFNLCLHNFSEFQVRIYMFVLIRKCKKDRYILNESYFGARFLSIRTEIGRLPIGFVLNSSFLLKFKQRFRSTATKQFNKNKLRV